MRGSNNYAPFTLRLASKHEDMLEDLMQHWGMTKSETMRLVIVREWEREFACSEERLRPKE